MSEGAELERARQSGSADALIIAVLRLGDDQRGIAQTKIEAIAVARLRIAGSRAGGVAVEDRGEKRKIARRVEFDARRRRGQGIGRSAGRQILIEETGPAEARVDEARRVIARQKFDVNADLTCANGELVAEFLLVPKFVKPRCRQRRDVVGREKLPMKFCERSTPWI